MSSAYPNNHNISKLPTFHSSDPGLESALNMLRNAIENKQPAFNVTLPGNNGTASWSDSSVIVRPRVSPRGQIAVGPWIPAFSYDKDGKLVVKFGLGVINNVAPKNIHKFITIPNEETLYYIIADLSFSGSKVGQYSIELTTTQPFDDPIAQDSIPTNFKLLLGMLKGTEYSMAYSTNLYIYPVQSFVTSKDGNLEFGEDPYHRWYGLRIESTYY